jgi:hypothetical protein
MAQDNCDGFFGQGNFTVQNKTRARLKFIRSVNKEKSNKFVFSEQKNTRYFGQI